MARGGARRQPRDARGRFSSTGATARGGRIKKASGKRATVTAKAKGAAPSGTIGRRPGKPSKPPTPANNIRPGRAPIRSGIRPYQPVTGSGRNAKGDRQWVRTAGNLSGAYTELKGIGKRAKQMRHAMQRQDARWITERSKPGIDGEIGRIMAQGANFKQANRAIRRRASRAAKAAAAGSKPAQKALQIYDQQLAFTGKGKPKAGKNNLRPGPRNTSGPPKRTRKPRKPRK
jgi:hypothetical protein